MSKVISVNGVKCLFTQHAHVVTYGFVNEPCQNVKKVLNTLYERYNKTDVIGHVSFDNKFNGYIKCVDNLNYIFKK